ncbi:hypothetical protein T484DRAFT_1881507, partial [Baffinella frigidus]
MVDRTGQWLGLLRDSGFVGEAQPARRSGGQDAVTEASSVIMQGITKTRRMLEQNRGVYMALRGGLEEQERDALDTAVRGFITDCGQRIDDLKGMVRGRAGGGANVQEHRRGMVLSLLESLDALSIAFQGFKAFRVQRAVASRQNFSALAGLGTGQGTGGGG